MAKGVRVAAPSEMTTEQGGREGPVGPEGSGGPEGPEGPGNCQPFTHMAWQ